MHNATPSALCKVTNAIVAAPGFLVFMNFSIIRLRKRPTDFLMSVLTIAVVISLVFVAIGSFNIAKISQGFERGVINDFQLQRLGEKIGYYDEVLTMSARMAAATGDLAWEERYYAFEPLLTDTIDRVIKLNNKDYDLQLDPVTKANIRLVEMEYESFRLIRQQKPQAALALLFSEEYKVQKEVYAIGMRRWSKILGQKIGESLKSYGEGLFLSSVFSIVSFWIMLITWTGLLFVINQYVCRQKAAEKRLRQAKRQLEVNHQDLQVSEAALQQKAATLEQTLQELQQAQVQMVQSEKMSSLGQLVAGVAHEINNPVNFIHANLSPISEYVTSLLGVVGSYQRHYPEPALEVQQEIEAADLDFIYSDLPKILGSMEVGTQRIRQIVLSLRNFSRSDESGCKCVDIHEGLESTLLILQYRLKDAGDCSALKVVRDYGSLQKVECYPGQLNQVFMNVLSNAIDAIDDAYIQRGDGKRGEITVRTQAQKIGGKDWVEIAVADTGLGMSDDVRSRIFDAFFTTKPVGKGTGMGLSISYTIITEKHEGRLACKSTLGQGNEFIIQIPVVRSAAGSSVAP